LRKNFNSLKTSADESAKGARNFFFENITRTQSLDCIQQMLPFVRKHNLIVDSEYRLNMLDVMELLLVLVKKEISIGKHIKAFEERAEKTKAEQENKKTQKSKKIIRKK
jgi:hypothetical protein